MFAVCVLVNILHHILDAYGNQLKPRYFLKYLVTPLVLVFKTHTVSKHKAYYNWFSTCIQH